MSKTLLVDANGTIVSPVTAEVFLAENGLANFDKLTVTDGAGWTAIQPSDDEEDVLRLGGFKGVALLDGANDQWNELSVEDSNWRFRHLNGTLNLAMESLTEDQVLRMADRYVDLETGHGVRAASLYDIPNAAALIYGGDGELRFSAFDLVIFYADTASAMRTGLGLEDGTAGSVLFAGNSATADSIYTGTEYQNSAQLFDGTGGSVAVSQAAYWIQNAIESRFEYNEGLERWQANGALDAAWALTFREGSFGDLNDDGGWTAAYLASEGAFSSDSGAIYSSGSGELNVEAVVSAGPIIFWTGEFGDTALNGGWVVSSLTTVAQPVGDLPPSAEPGTFSFVTDALAPTAGATVVSGGAAARPVVYDGVSWKSLY